MIKIEQLSEETIKSQGIDKWPIWEKEISRFDWQYSSVEKCYIIQGRAEIHVAPDDVYEIKKGDLVTFPAGLKCVWDIKEKIVKNYNFL